jgi:transposase-like protein
VAGKRYTPEVRAAVLKLGLDGATYRVIQERYRIPKSTLSFWFNSLGKSPTRDKKKMAAYLAKARTKAAETIRKNKEARIEKATEAARTVAVTIPISETCISKGLLAMLYWAEGSKGEPGVTTFTNTDPLLSQFYVELLRKSFDIDESKFRVRLHLHYYHRHGKALDFWSKQLRIPKSQFGKIYVKKRSTQKRFRQNFQGICFVVYHDSSIRRELMALGRILAEQHMPL